MVHFHEYWVEKVVDPLEGVLQSSACSRLTHANQGQTSACVQELIMYLPLQMAQEMKPVGTR